MAVCDLIGGGSKAMCVSGPLEMRPEAQRSSLGTWAPGTAVKPSKTA